MKRRRAYSLIELLLIMSAMCLIFGLCVGLIHSSLRLDRGARAHLNETMTVDRLARQFREDAHAANHWTKSTDKTTHLDRLELTRLDGHVVLYESQVGRLVRTERVSDQKPRYEPYRLRQRGSVEFSIQDEKDRAFVVLAIPHRSTEPGAHERSTIQIQATLGKDRGITNAEGRLR